MNNDERSYITDDSKVGDQLHDPEPDADVLRPLGHGPACLADELLGVQSDLHPVVEEGKQGRQGEGRHEDCDEAKLQHYIDCFYNFLWYNENLPISRYSWNKPSFSTSL